MENEMFANGGFSWHETRPIDSSLLGEKITKENLGDHVKIAKYKFTHTKKLLARLVSVLVFLLILYIAVLFVPMVVDFYNNASWKGSKHSCETKEGLQWLGASADVIRSDYENNQDSLAEKALKNERRTTDLSDTKAAFTSRERMTTPEEELLKKISQ